MTITGEVATGFGGIADTLQQSIDQGTDLGAGVTLIADGQVIVDIRGGWRDRKMTTPFGDTKICIHSTGKAISAAMLMVAVNAGLLDYDAPVAQYWPEFAAHGKGELTVAQAMSHQAGLAAFTEEMDPADWLDWDHLCQKLADMPPLWTPGTANGYHPQTVGYIVGELIRRTTKNTIGGHLRRMDLDVVCGIPVEEQSEIGTQIKPPAPPILGEITDLKRAAFLSKWSYATRAGVDKWMAAEMPASNMHGTSLGVAKIIDAFVKGEMDGKKVASADILEQALAERIRGDDLVLPFDMSWAAGLMRNNGGVFGPSPTAVGHYGFGGACVFADPPNGLTFVYVPNKMSSALVADERAMALIQKVYELI